MENAGYIALSRQIAVRRNLDIVANNIANMNTVGFKAQNLMFEEYLSGSPADKINSFNMVNDFGQYMDTEEGQLRQTGNPLDLAMKGGGYFAVQTPVGERYTRAGQFQLNQLGEIVTGQGYPVLSDSNAPIVVPQGTSEIRITNDGDVVADSTTVGRFGRFAFENDQDLTQIGFNLYAAPDNIQPQKTEDPDILQGVLESSNVNPIIEMTKMLALSRSDNSAQKIVQGEHERLRGMIRKLGDQS